MLAQNEATQVGRMNEIPRHFWGFCWYSSVYFNEVQENIWREFLFCLACIWLLFFSWRVTKNQRQAQVFSLRLLFHVGSVTSTRPGYSGLSLVFSGKDRKDMLRHWRNISGRCNSILTHFLALFSDRIKNIRSVDSHIGNEFTFRGLFLINTKNKSCPGCSSKFTFLAYFHFQKICQYVLCFLFPHANVLLKRHLRPVLELWLLWFSLWLSWINIKDQCYCFTVICGHKKDS